jgi:hypothetical protein
MKIILLALMLTAGVGFPRLSYAADTNNGPPAVGTTNQSNPDFSKAFLDYVKMVQDENKLYRESVEGFFTKLTYLLTFAGVLLGSIVAFVGFNTNRGIEKWLENNFNRIAGKQIESRIAILDAAQKKLEEDTAAAQKQIEANLGSAKKLEDELNAKQQLIETKTLQFEERLSRVVRKVNFNIIYFFVTDGDWELLKKLAAEQAAIYNSKAQPQLPANLRRLRDRLELIKMQPKPDRGHYTVGEMPAEGDLKIYCKLTEIGQDLVKTRLEEEREDEKVAATRNV